MWQKTTKKIFDMEIVHVCNIGISSIHGNELLGQSSFHHEYKRSHIETKCFDLSTRLVSAKDEISEWKQLVGRIVHGNICLWLVMKELSIFSAQRSTSFQILYCVLGGYTRLQSTVHGKTDWVGLKHLRNTETLTELTASQWNSSGIFSQDSIRCSSVKSMFNDISCGSRDNEKECEANAQLVSLYAKRFGIGQW